MYNSTLYRSQSLIRTNNAGKRTVLHTEQTPVIILNHTLYMRVIRTGLQCRQCADMAVSRGPVRHTQWRPLKGEPTVRCDGNDSKNESLFF